MYIPARIRPTIALPTIFASAMCSRFTGIVRSVSRVLFSFSSASEEMREDPDMIISIMMRMGIIMF